MAYANHSPLFFLATRRRYDCGHQWLGLSTTNPSTHNPFTLQLTTHLFANLQLVHSPPQQLVHLSICQILLIKNGVIFFFNQHRNKPFFVPSALVRHLPSLHFHSFLARKQPFQPLKAALSKRQRPMVALQKLCF